LGSVIFIGHEICDVAEFVVQKQRKVTQLFELHPDERTTAVLLVVIMLEFALNRLAQPAVSPRRPPDIRLVDHILRSNEAQKERRRMNRPALSGSAKRGDRRQHFKRASSQRKAAALLCF